MNEEKRLYHGSSSIVRIPDLSMSRMDIDFGQGFYLTEDYKVSAKWASRTTTSICNEYTISFKGLNVYEFELNKEWLDYVIKNRNLEEFAEKGYEQYDVIIGPIADDRLFHTIELYEDGLISAENTISVMNCMEYGRQYVIKTDKAVNNLKYEGHKKIIGQEKEMYRKLYKDDRQEATRRTHQMIRKLNGR